MKAGFLISFVLWIGIFAMAGCLSKRNAAKTPTMNVTTPSGTKVEAKGDAEVPGKVETKSTNTVVALPLGTTLTFNQTAGTIDVLLKAPSSLHQTTVAERVEAPRAFVPPAPPTPQEVAKGQATLYFWIGLVVGICAAVFGLVRAWNLVMYGGIAVAAGCAFAIFVQDNPLVLWLIGFGVLLKVAGPLIWHTYLKHKQPSTNAS